MTRPIPAGDYERPAALTPRSGTRSAHLRKAAARTLDDLWNAIAAILPTFSSEECKNYFTNSGYDPE
jgi:hypothetical protein